MLCLQQEDYCKDQYCGYDSQEYPVYGFLGFCCLPSGIRSPGFNRREIFQKLLGLFLMGGRDHDFVAGNRVAGIKLLNSSLNSCINTVFFQKRKHLLRLNTAFYCGNTDQFFFHKAHSSSKYFCSCCLCFLSVMKFISLSVKKQRTVIPVKKRRTAVLIFASDPAFLRIANT